MLEDEFYGRCALESDGCMGRITLEHAIIHAGRQLNEKWAIIPLCAYHHSVDEFQDGDGLDKELNEWVALSRATAEDLVTYSKAVDYLQRVVYLTGKYGVYDPVRRGWDRKPDNSGYYETAGGERLTGDNLLETGANESENWLISSGCSGDKKGQVESIGELLHNIRKDLHQFSTGRVDNSKSKYGSTNVPNRVLVE